MESKKVERLKRFYRERGERVRRWVEQEQVGGVDLTPVFEKGLGEKGERPIVVVGEAPGREEVERGVPFVGMAGRNLRYLVEEEGELSRERDLLITNIFPARTYKIGKGGGVVNRKPTSGELKFGAQLLGEELEILEPPLLLLLGESARQGFSHLFKPVKKLEKCGFYLLINSPIEEVKRIPVGGFWINLCRHWSGKTPVGVEGVVEPPIPNLPKFGILKAPLPRGVEKVSILGICHHPSPLAFQRPLYRHQLEFFFQQVGIIWEFLTHLPLSG
ncbi:MAG: uracil-DNA glycosylase family protein [Campylobacterales bacterium]